MVENTKIVILHERTDKNLCISVKELRQLVDLYPVAHPMRLAWLIMATCGLRPGEVAGNKNPVKESDWGLRLNNLINDFQYIRYITKKPTNKYYHKTQTLVSVYKERTVKIEYELLRKELKIYVARNYHTMTDGKLFPFTYERFKRELYFIRNKIKKGTLKGENWLGFLDETREIILTTSKHFKRRFRITPHSFRRFYNTYKLWCVYGGDIVLSTKDLAHTRIDTNLIYSYSPDKIGLSKDDVKNRVTFEHLFSTGKGQMLIHEYI